MENEMLLSMKGISKSFPGVIALKDVDLEVKRGQVLALMGENGAGKSTIIKILTGVQSKDEGEIIFEGKNINPKSPKQAQDSGISTIYQELNLVPSLSVAENFFAGRHPRRFGLIDWKKIYADAAFELNKLGVDIDVHNTLESYSVAVQQMVAIARAVSMKSKLIIMDEPTSSLDDKEVAILFEIISRIKKQGVAVIFITHKLDEIYQISDQVTILRDGKLVANVLTKDLSKLDLISNMIGRDAKDIISYKKKYQKDIADRETSLLATGICNGIRLKGIDLEIKEGEVVGLAGLMGSGRTEFARAIFAADKCDVGEIIINGKRTKFRIPKQSIKHGMGFLSEDRKVEGIVPHLSVKENMAMATLPQYTKFGVVQNVKISKMVDSYIKALQIKTPSQEQAIRNLSGGNQQKVILARWLAIKPKLLILDEPTRGIDVGAKAEIEQLIQKMAAEGISILFISSEFDELIRNCDRIAILRDGVKLKELVGDEISESELMRTIAQYKAERN